MEKVSLTGEDGRKDSLDRGKRYRKAQRWIRES